MCYDHSENKLVQESAGHLLQNELGWEVAFAHNTEVLGVNGTFGRTSYQEILLTRYFRAALKKLNPRITSAQMDEAQKKLENRLPTASLYTVLLLTPNSFAATHTVARYSATHSPIRRAHSSISCFKDNTPMAQTPP